MARHTSTKNRLYSGILIAMVAASAGLAIYIRSLENPALPYGQHAATTHTAKVPARSDTLYVDPTSDAARQADGWRHTRPTEAALLDTLAALPTAKWLTTMSALDDLGPYLQDAARQHTVAVLVSYYIPLRDCGQYSAGGATNADEYTQFIDTLARKVGAQPAILIIEPDALAEIGTTGGQGQQCLSQKDKRLYYALLRYAVKTFKALPATKVYLDAGNSNWEDAREMADRLRLANIEAADGFSLNISNFQTTVNSIAYGRDIVRALGLDKHFIIDTSRNGLGPYQNPQQPDYDWCNPPGRALGHRPTLNTGLRDIDAYLYIKTPGESDGYDPDTNKCFNGPPAGDWWAEYAVGLVQNWPVELQQP